MAIDNLLIVEKPISDREGVGIEFKESTGQLDRSMETICAFLNGNGGTLLIGVSDKGKIVGQEVSDKTKRDIAEAINRIEPVAPVQISYLAIDGSSKKIIALHVDDARSQRPFCYKGRPYMRVESLTTTMPLHLFKELLYQQDENIQKWEKQACKSLTISDLDAKEVLKTVRLGRECGRLPEDTGDDVTEILEKLGLLSDGILNNAAAVLFGRLENMEFPQCAMQLARFKGLDKTDFLDSQFVNGNIFVLVNAAMAFIFKHLCLSGTTNKLERE